MNTRNRPGRNTSPLTALRPTPFGLGTASGVLQGRSSVHEVVSIAGVKNAGVKGVASGTRAEKLNGHMAALDKDTARHATHVSLSPNSDETTSHSTKPASGQVAGYLPEGESYAGSLREIHVNRVTGGGRESGFAITGAAWQRDGSITGTEGSAATRRNPTQRGEQRSMGMQIPAVKEHLQVPPSKITGSSGNAATGSTITYSGGARG